MSYDPQDIQSIQLFDGLSVSQRLALMEIAKRLPVEAGTVVLKEEELGSSFFVIIKGSVKVKKQVVLGIVFLNVHKESV